MSEAQANGAAGATSEVTPRVIVVAADGSPESEYAVQFARSLSESSGASLRVVHVEVDSSYANLAGAGAVIATDAAEEESTVRVRVGVAGLLDGLDNPWDYTVRDGDASDAIIAFAAELDADLIVVGHRSHGRLGDFLLGSVASKVVHNARRSVLVATRPTG